LQGWNAPRRFHYAPSNPQAKTLPLLQACFRIQRNWIIQ
jgi:hypothetical protein